MKSFLGLLYFLGDFTPRLAWHGSDWRRDLLNENRTEPRILLPHKIRHLTPGAKVIMIVRNPTHRYIYSPTYSTNFKPEGASTGQSIGIPMK